MKGFTARANSGVSPDKRGTFAGVIEKIPYLKELGRDRRRAAARAPVRPAGRQLLGLHDACTSCRPHRGYAAGDPAREFRDMVKAFHAAGIEVVLDVVYNHTSEGDENGPTYSYRGIDNGSYYLLTPDLPLLQQRHRLRQHPALRPRSPCAR